jgi:hypothetical protein
VTSRSATGCDLRFSCHTERAAAIDEADVATGRVLYVDGGATARMGLWSDQGDRPQ